MVDAGLIKG